jgi:hypothetical protein
MIGIKRFLEVNVAKVFDFSQPIYYNELIIFMEAIRDLNLSIRPIYNFIGI